MYQGCLNGRVPVDEAAKLNYMLTGIRTDLEADEPPQIDQTRRPLSSTRSSSTACRRGTFLPKEEIDRLNSQFVEQPPAHIAGPPMLKVFDVMSTRPIKIPSHPRRPSEGR